MKYLFTIIASIVLGNAAFAEQLVVDAEGSVYVSTVEEIRQALSDQNVKRIKVAPGRYVLHNPDHVHKGKFIWNRPVSLQGSGVDKTVFVASDYTNHWPGFWVGPWNTNGTAKSTVTHIANQRIYRHTNRITLPADAAVPSVGEWVQIQFGVDPTDPAEAYHYKFFKVRSVNGSVVELDRQVGIDVPVFPEGTKDWVLPNQEFWRNKVAPYGTKSPYGQIGKGYGLDHSLIRFQGEPLVNFEFRDFSIEYAGPESHPTTHSALILRSTFGFRCENVNFIRPGFMVHAWHSERIRFDNVNGLGMVNDRLNGYWWGGSPVAGWGCSDLLWQNSRFIGKNFVNGMLENQAECVFRNCLFDIEYVKLTDLANTPEIPSFIAGNNGGRILTLYDCEIRIKGGRWLQDIQGLQSRIQKSIVEYHNCNWEFRDNSGQFIYTDVFKGPMVLNGKFSPARITSKRTYKVKTNQHGAAFMLLPTGMYHRVYVVKTEAIAKLLDGDYDTPKDATFDGKEVWHLKRYDQWRPGTYTFGAFPAAVRIYNSAPNTEIEFDVYFDWRPEFQY